MSALPEGYEEIGERVIIRPMLTISQAIDLFLGDLARQGRTERTRDNYARTLDKFADQFPRIWDVAKVQPEDCEAFLDRWQKRKRGTQAQVHAPLAGLFRFLYRTRRIKHNPMEFVPTPKRERSEDLDVVTVNPLDVPALLREAHAGAERNCLAILAYMGPRRRAAALLKLEDYDRRHGRLRFREKGGKVIWKPIPHELRDILEASIARGEITAEQPYLIPPQASLRRKDKRDDRVVWRIVKDVAGRCGLEAHTHALRAAFAHFYLLENPGDSRGLQKLMGHTSPTTTEIYLRKFNNELAMEPVRSLSWLGGGRADSAELTTSTEATSPVGPPVDCPDNAEPAESPQTAAEQFESSPLVGAGGFEPPLPVDRLVQRRGRQSQTNEGSQR